jgi:hypothetical protein
MCAVLCCTHGTFIELFLVSHCFSQVKGPDSSPVCSYSSNHLLDITPGSPQGGRQLDTVPIQLTIQKPFFTFGWLHNLGIFSFLLLDISYEPSE